MNFNRRRSELEADADGAAVKPRDVDGVTIADSPFLHVSLDTDVVLESFAASLDGGLILFFGSLAASFDMSLDNATTRFPPSLDESLGTLSALLSDGDASEAVMAFLAPIDADPAFPDDELGGAERP